MHKYGGNAVCATIDRLVAFGPFLRLADIEMHAHKVIFTPNNNGFASAVAAAV
jgi:hypothetical protein